MYITEIDCDIPGDTYFPSFDKNQFVKEINERFEKMLRAIQEEYNSTLNKMEKLKTEGKTKTATYKQLMGTKLMLQNMLSRYEIYGLLDG